MNLEKAIIDDYADQVMFEVELIKSLMKDNNLETLKHFRALSQDDRSLVLDLYR